MKKDNLIEKIEENIDVIRENIEEIKSKLETIVGSEVIYKHTFKDGKFILAFKRK